MKFNRWEPDDSGKFTFLGFDFYWARTWRNPNHKIVKRRTNKEKFRASLTKFKEWIKVSRSWRLPHILAAVRVRLVGYWNYYGVIGNSSMTWRYYQEVKKLLFKWLNRRSHRRSFTWEKFAKMWEEWALPAPRWCRRNPSINELLKPAQAQLNF